MRVYLDTEFMENGFTIRPLSFGLVGEDGQEYYAECSTYSLENANEFVRKNVLPNIKSYKPGFNFLSVEKGAKPIQQIKEEILEFCGKSPEFWGYYCAYDWVLICQMFGSMTDLPKDQDWPMYCLDLKQEMYMFNVTKENIEKRYPQPTTHNALDDARWIRNAQEHLGENF